MRRARKNNRLDYYDYSLSGWYFVTFCIQGRVNWFGRIINGRMELNERGRIARQAWLNIPDHYENIGIDEFVIMPNHVHGIVVIGDEVDGVVVGTGVGMCVGTGHRPVRDDMERNIDYLHKRTGQCPVPTATTTPHHPYGQLSKVINAFKGAATKQIQLNFPDLNFAWQRSFYDHIIRNEQDYWRIVKYIRSNPVAWPQDRNNLDAKNS